jgi:aspartyl/asparaginyl beta-hydroxylase (cupin superfamily)
MYFIFQTTHTQDGNGSVKKRLTERVCIAELLMLMGAFFRLLGDPFFEPLCFYPELQNNKENRPRNRRQHNEV